MCCKHIALANLELPFTKFHYGGHWEKRSDIPLEEIVLDDVSSLPASNELASSVSTSLPTWDIIEHYLADLSNLLNMVDKGKPVPHQSEIINSIKRTSELCKIHFPLLPEYDLNRTRKKQRTNK